MIFQDWATFDGTQNYFLKAAVATDQYDATYVAGATLNSSGNYDILVSKYDPSGNVVWTDTYDGAGNGDDAALAIQVDSHCNLYLTGTTFTSTADTLDVITINYDSAGARQWIAVYSGSDGLADGGTTIAADQNYLYVGGVETGSTTEEDFLVLKYSFSGSLIWSNTYDENGTTDVCTDLRVGIKKITLVGATQTGAYDWDYLTASFGINTGTMSTHATASGGTAGFDKVTAMEKDGFDNIYITGTAANGVSGYDVFTIKLDTNLNVVWDATYNSGGSNDDVGNAIAIDGSGNIIVGGYSTTTSQNTDFTTIKYNSSGVQQWVQSWNDVADSSDTLKSILVEPSGDIIVSGTAWDGLGYGFHSIKYNTSGSIVWEIPFKDKYGYDDHVVNMAHCQNGGFVVAGQSVAPNGDLSYVTVKYDEASFVMPVDSDSVSTAVRFIENRDQLVDTDGNPVDQVRYYTNKSYPSIYLMDDTVSYVFAHIDDDSTTQDTLARVSMSLMNSNASKKMRNIEKDAHFSNYYLGHIPEGRPYVSQSKYVFLEDAWDKIDIKYSSNQAGFNYFIVINPGGDPESIELKFDGQDTVSVDTNGSLVTETIIGNLVQPKANAYKMDLISGELTAYNWQPSYVVSSNVVSFENLGDFDSEYPLVIEISLEPQGISSGTAGGNLSWSTYIGGNNDDGALGLAIDNNGYVYNIGHTHGSSFPIYNSNTFFMGAIDAYIGKFSKDAVQKWTTYLGGTGGDYGAALSIDFSNKLFGSGVTSSIDFPLRAGPYYQSSKGGAIDLFVFRMNSIDGSLEWSTYFGGDQNDFVSGIEVNSSGDLYIAGTTFSSTPDLSPGDGLTLTLGAFPLLDPGNNAYFQDALRDENDGFIAQIRMDHGGALGWSTYFGGDCSNCSVITLYDNLWDLKIDPSNDDVYICGKTWTTTVPASEPVPCQSNSDGDFPVCDDGGYFQTSYSNGNVGTGYIAQFSTTNHVLEWSTFFGTGTSEIALYIDDNSNVFSVGTVKSAITASNSCSEPGFGEFPICDNSGNSYIQSTFGGVGDVFLNRFSSNHSLVWSTLFGGPYRETQTLNGGMSQNLSQGWAIEGDMNGNIFLAGTVGLPSFITSTQTISLQYSSWFDQSLWGNYNEPEPSSDAVLVGFESDNSLFWHTPFGGARFPNGRLGGSNGWEETADIAIDKANDKLYITGTSGSPYTPYECPGSAQNHFCRLLAPPAGYQFDGFLSQFDISSHPTLTDGEELLNSNLHLFPNPTFGKFTISGGFDKPKALKIRILNNMGAIVKTLPEIKAGTKFEVEVDLSSLVGGLYLIEVTSDQNRIVKKLIKL